MTPDQLRAFAAQLMSKVDTVGRKIHRDQTIIEQLTHEIAILKRHGVGVSHNPESNMKLASGPAPVPAMQAAGLAA